MQTVNLKVDQLTGNEIIIREGKALEQKPPEKIKIEGDIKSISNFLSIRKDNPGHEHQLVDPNRVIVTVDKKEMYIELETDPGNTYGTVVTGSLELSDELKKWGVQQGKMYTLKDLVYLFRMNKLDFDRGEVAVEMEKAYMSFNIKQFIEFEQQQPDQKGNRKNSFEKKVDMDKPTQFKLNIPVYKGFPSTAFDVELCLNTRENTVDFWFESVELHELLITEKERIFNEELKSCEGFVIINK
jgi:hypothetical protein